MELQEAIEYLKDYANWVRRLNREYPDAIGVAIDTVLAELDKRYYKGYQDGYKQAKYEVEIDKLNI